MSDAPPPPDDYPEYTRPPGAGKPQFLGLIVLLVMAAIFFPINHFTDQRAAEREREALRALQKALPSLIELRGQLSRPRAEREAPAADQLIRYRELVDRLEAARARAPKDQELIRQSRLGWEGYSVAAMLVGDFARARHAVDQLETLGEAEVRVEMMRDGIAAEEKAAKASARGAGSGSGR